MPRENRKRGKKNKKKADQEPQSESLLELEGHPNDVREPLTTERQGEPSWLISAPSRSEEFNIEAPFGFVDTEVKAYFRTVDIQIRDWQENGLEDGEVDVDLDPNEGLYFMGELEQCHSLRCVVREEVVLRRCSHRDVREGKTARYRP
jgi:hypothetical protein